MFTLQIPIRSAFGRIIQFIHRYLHLSRERKENPSYCAIETAQCSAHMSRLKKWDLCGYSFPFGASCALKLLIQSLRSVYCTGCSPPMLGLWNGEQSIQNVAVAFYSRPLGGYFRFQWIFKQLIFLRQRLLVRAAYVFVCYFYLTRNTCDIVMTQNTQ